MSQLSDSMLGRRMHECMVDYLKAIQAGVSREDACKGIEEVLRAESGFRLTKFPSCPECGGSAQRVVYCMHNLRCGRERCSQAEAAWEHEYVMPCDCDLGEALRQRRMARPVDDELEQVGKVRKRGGGFSRVWR